MLEQLKKKWWILALRGASSIGFGIFALLWPEATLAASIVLYGSYAVANGVLAAGTAVTRRRGGTGLAPLWMEALCGSSLGLAVWLWPGLTVLALVYMVASWAILTGLFEFVAAVQLREEIEGEWLLAAAALVSVAFGVALAAQPVARTLVLVWLLGGYAILFGLFIAGLAIGLRLQEPPGAVRALRS